MTSSSKSFKKNYRVCRDLGVVEDLKGASESNGGWAEKREVGVFQVSVIEREELLHLCRFQCSPHTICIIF
jgi:hypothetical protein